MLAYVQCVFRMKVYEPKDGSCSQSRGPYSKALVSSLVSCSSPGSPGSPVRGRVSDQIESS